MQRPVSHGRDRPGPAALSAVTLARDCASPSNGPGWPSTEVRRSTLLRMSSVRCLTSLAAHVLLLKTPRASCATGASSGSEETAGPRPLPLAVSPSSGLSSGAGATGSLATIRGRLAPLATARTTLVFRPCSPKRTKEGCRLLRSVRGLRLLRQLGCLRMLRRPVSSLAWGTVSGHAVTSPVVTSVADALGL